MYVSEFERRTVSKSSSWYRASGKLDVPSSPFVFSAYSTRVYYKQDANVKHEILGNRADRERFSTLSGYEVVEHDGDTTDVQGSFIKGDGTHTIRFRDFVHVVLRRKIPSHDEAISSARNKFPIVHRQSPHWPSVPLQSHRIAWISSILHSTKVVSVAFRGRKDERTKLPVSKTCQRRIRAQQSTVGVYEEEVHGKENEDTIKKMCVPTSERLCLLIQRRCRSRFEQCNG